LAFLKQKSHNWGKQLAEHKPFKLAHKRGVHLVSLFLINFLGGILFERYQIIVEVAALEVVNLQQQHQQIKAVPQYRLQNVCSPERFWACQLV
jgi:hypothetical protein